VTDVLDRGEVKSRQGIFHSGQVDLAVLEKGRAASRDGRGDSVQYF